ncbi:MAG: hypothetical protein AB7P21_00160 [Lautropia sp.]
MSPFAYRPLACRPSGKRPAAVAAVIARLAVAAVIARLAAAAVALLLVNLLPSAFTALTGLSGVEARAQASSRAIPEAANLGTLKIGNFPQATLDGAAVTLGPGFRLYDLLNRIVVPASISGTPLVVAYVRGAIGEVVEAWQLNDAELADRQRLIAARKARGAN